MTTTTADGLGAFGTPHHSGWEPKRATTLAQARRRTAFVRTLRFALMAAAAAISALVIVQIVLSMMGEVEPDAITVGEDARMVNPRFTGRDEGGAPFTVTADAAIRRQGDALNLTELENPRLDYESIAALQTAPDGVLAERGFYDSENRILDLETDVRFRTGSGYEFISETARLLLQEDRVIGNSPVEGSGPMGDIRADSYEILDGGDRVVFTGGVVAHIENRRTAAQGDQP
tara:strand:+ start:11892 stop:12587 length:696 start_codon:yes stop_codon:yes gene_type:complete